MKYYIQRQLTEYGPYTLADLQRYVAQGNILLTDLTRSEGMTDWVPVSQVLGNIPVPVPMPAMPMPGAPAYGGQAYTGGAGAYGGAGAVYPGAMPAAATAGPVPIDFHWAAVLVIGIVTCGLFWWAWLMVEAAFVRKVKSNSKGLLFAIISCVIYFVGSFINVAILLAQPPEPVYWGRLLTVIAIAFWLIAAFRMKDDLESYYNTTEPINLRLNGWLTFFFALWYFQHHFSRIAQWKKTGILEPQG